MPCHRITPFIPDVPQPVKSSILLIAGDVSGDINTARLAKTLLERNPDWTLYAVGGPHLGGEVTKSPGGLLIGDASDLSGIGIYSSLKMYPRAKMIQMRILRFIREHTINAAVLCDWGAFNCRLLPSLTKAGVPVLYYFPPRSWQRTGSGGLGVVSSVDRVATPFEWSAQRLRAAGCKAEWVGHPMLEVKYSMEKRVALRSEFGVTNSEKLVALLPGSRLSEINCLAPRLATTAEILHKRTGLHCIVPVSQQRVETVKKHFPGWVKIVTDRTADVLFASDAAVVKSGSATLEAAVIGTPQVVVYDFPWIGKLEWLLLWMWKRNIPYIAMPNVILQRMAVQELLGLDCRPESIASAVAELLEDKTKRDRMAEDYQQIRQHLGAFLSKPATLRTAEIVEELLLDKKSESIQR